MLSFQKRMANMRQPGEMVCTVHTHLSQFSTSCQLSLLTGNFCPVQSGKLSLLLGWTDGQGTLFPYPAVPSPVPPPPLLRRDECQRADDAGAGARPQAQRYHKQADMEQGWSDRGRGKGEEGAGARCWRGPSYLVLCR